MIALAHAIFAAVLAFLFNLNPLVTMLFSLVPDAEVLLPTFHRGPLHSLLFIIPTGLAIMIYDRTSAKSATTGMVSHIFLDSLTMMGVPLFYPLVNKYFSLYFFNTNQLTFLVIIFLTIILANKSRIHMKKQEIILIILLIIFALSPLAGRAKPIFTYNCPSNIIPLEEVVLHPEEYVLVEGVVCSDIKDYTSNSGTKYQDFKICNDTQVRVFKKTSIQENLFARGNILRICAKYTENYGGELYYIKYVKVS